MKYARATTKLADVIEAMALSPAPTIQGRLGEACSYLFQGGPLGIRKAQPWVLPQSTVGDPQVVLGKHLVSNLEPTRFDVAKFGSNILQSKP
jgi:hypothetical protein